MPGLDKWVLQTSWSQLKNPSLRARCLLEVMLIGLASSRFLTVESFCGPHLHIGIELYRNSSAVGTGEVGSLGDDVRGHLG